MALKEGKLFACFGNMGGFMQPQGHVQLMVNMIDHHLDPQTALNVPRFCIDDGTANGEIYFEGMNLLSYCHHKPTITAEGYPASTIQTLKSMGHHLREQVLTKLERSLFGNGQIITRDNESGVLCGGSDSRADGLAIAW